MKDALMEQILSILSGVCLALISIWLKEIWSDQRKFRSVVDALKNEIKGIHKKSKSLEDEITIRLGKIDMGGVLLIPFGQFYDSIWFTFRNSGFLPRIDTVLIEKLNETYDSCERLNKLSLSYQQIIFNPLTAYPDPFFQKMRKDILDVMLKEIKRLDTSLKALRQSFKYPPFSQNRKRRDEISNLDLLLLVVGFLLFAILLVLLAFLIGLIR